MAQQSYAPAPAPHADARVPDQPTGYVAPHHETAAPVAVEQRRSFSVRVVALVAAVAFVVGVAATLLFGLLTGGPGGPAGGGPGGTPPGTTSSQTSGGTGTTGSST